MGNLVKSIAVEVYLGKRMQEEYGSEIKRRYKEGESSRVIVEQMNLFRLYEVSKSTALRAVGFALRGYSIPEGMNLSLPCYQGLFSLEDMRTLSLQHKESTGNFMAANGIGVHGFSREDRANAGSSGGKTQYEKKIGIHAQTLLDKVNLGRESARKRGLVVWSDRELDDTLELVKMHSAQETATIINRDYHASNKVRTSTAVRVAVFKAKKRKSEELK